MFSLNGVIADTSIWIEHLKATNSELITLLSERRILVHSVIIGELACGNFKKRNEFLDNLKILPFAQVAELLEVLELIESQKLFGKGLGFNDVQILASALLSNASVLSHDQAMMRAARELGVSEY